MQLPSAEESLFTLAERTEMSESSRIPNVFAAQSSSSSQTNRVGTNCHTESEDKKEEMRQDLSENDTSQSGMIGRQQRGNSDVSEWSDLQGSRTGSQEWRGSTILSNQEFNNLRNANRGTHNGRFSRHSIRRSSLTTPQPFTMAARRSITGSVTEYQMDRVMRMTHETSDSNDDQPPSPDNDPISFEPTLLQNPTSMDDSSEDNSQEYEILSDTEFERRQQAFLASEQSRRPRQNVYINGQSAYHIRMALMDSSSSQTSRDSASNITSSSTEQGTFRTELLTTLFRDSQLVSSTNNQQS